MKSMMNRLGSRTRRLNMTGLFLAAGFLLAHAEANWPRWRGPQDNGSTGDGRYPVRWDAGSVRWKTPLPGKGCSTPILWNDRIYLTAPVDGLDALLAFDGSGQSVWRTTFGPEKAGKHRNGSGSNASPATDGAGVFVYFKSGTLAAVELDGEIRWQTNLVERFGPDTLFWDHGTSPVLTERHVVMARMHGGESWLAAFDKETGAMAWKVDRNFRTPTEGDNGYGTPLAIRHEGREALLVYGAEHITAHDAVDGGLLWSCGGFNPEGRGFWPTIASPVVAGDVVVVAAGRNDRNLPRLHGVRLGGRGDVTATHQVWKRHDTGTFVPTPAEHGGRLYLVRDRGQVECLDPSTGRTVWSGELPRDRASYYASPLIAGGNLYAAREDGVVFVLKVGGGFELLAENDLGERVLASPVPGPGPDRLLIRGEQHLFCIAP